MRSRNLASYIGGAVLGIGVVIPLLVLLPLGWLWLWQNGYVLHWFIGALALMLVSFGARIVLLARLKAALANQVMDAEARERERAFAQVASPRELAAWRVVEARAAEVDPYGLTSYDAVVELGVETVELVARHMHPDHRDPLWRFTVPEALALIERIARDLRPLLVRNVPLGDQLTVGQLRTIYRWRSLIDVAERAYDIWRIVRLMNPIAAASQEIRDKLSRHVYEGVRDELAKRLASAFVREVGRAAIDLYSGRLSLDEDVLASHVSESTRKDRAAPVMAEPLRFLVAGQISSGKSSLINALAEEVKAAVDALPTTREFNGYEVQREGMPQVMLIDSPGIEAGASGYERLAEKAADSDVVVWVAPAHRADREIDDEALAAIAGYFASRPHRRPPPMLLVLTHIDRLRPIQDWNPPYDVAAPSTPKAVSIRAAMDEAGRELGFGIGEIVPVCLAQGVKSYNVELVWAKLAELLPEARSAQLVRCLYDATGSFDWRTLLGQSLRAGRLVVSALAGTVRRG